MNKILEAAENYAKAVHGYEGSGHDWWHIYRVNKLACSIAREEGANLFICSLAALMHDIADEKLNGSEEEGLQKVERWLKENDVPAHVSTEVLNIISTMSYKGGNTGLMSSLEGKVVQDADRLDAIGAIGIARTFVYSGHIGQLIYDPDVMVRSSMTKDEYRNGTSTAVNHFYEKLLKLKSRMNTEYGKKLAARRHEEMEHFLGVFFEEWEGRR
ncbi:HD domain-containing protein [Fictibacillus sp. S7]|uniref:HD domain-containing protein n=1 Tax=Fictibacillus sp. S7 TaxID=2212476 RepID=UPI001013654B|nr:HD domain-containing protein [Fictibacillus sp. S7]RXY99079.1 phosphohydrolase [Fictibacillus sp. S7]